MYKTVDEELLVELRCAFDLFDTDKGGTIQPEELCSAISTVDVKISIEDIKEMINYIGLANNVEEMTFPEFASLIISKMRKQESEEEITEVFKIFDKKGVGKIAAGDVKTVLGEIEEPISQEELDFIMEKFDKDKDGFLNFEEFKAMMESA